MLLTLIKINKILNLMLDLSQFMLNHIKLDSVERSFKY